MLVPSPYPSPANQVIPELYPQFESLAISSAGADRGSPPHGVVSGSNHSDQNSDEWILGPWPSTRNSPGDPYSPAHQTHNMTEARPTHQRSRSHQYMGGAQNPFNFQPQGMPGPGTGYMPSAAMPSPQMGLGGGGHMPNYPPSPYHQAALMTPYMGHQQQAPMPGAWLPPTAGAIVPLGAIQNKLGRPKEEQGVATDRWHAGPDYGVVLDSLQFDVLKASVVVHPILLPQSASPKLPNIVFDLLFPINRIYLSNQRSDRSWSMSHGRQDPATFPRLSQVRIISPNFPWMIDVRNPNGVTCEDICEKLYHFFHQKVDKSEWDNVDDESRKAITASYKWNRSTHPAAPGGSLPEALTRGDFLGRATRFDGLVVDNPFVKDRLNAVSGAVLVLLLSEWPSQQ